MIHIEDKTGLHTVSFLIFIMYPRGHPCQVDG